MGDSAGRLQYIVRDIADLGKTFNQESGHYVGAMPMDGSQCPFGCPRAGTALTDRMLENALRMIGEVHLQVGQAMANHGTKLSLAAQRYAAAEVQANASVYDVFLAAETAPLPPDLPHE